MRISRNLLVIISLIINIAAISLSHASEKPEGFQPDGFQAAPAYKSGFCGWATGGECKTDSDCIKGGCSAQVCQSGKEGAVITTCEWRECYNASKYKVSCKCIVGDSTLREGRCEWGKE